VRQSANHARLAKSSSSCSVNMRPCTAAGALGEYVTS
jgi:hypothetical protein